MRKAPKYSYRRYFLTGALAATATLGGTAFYSWGRPVWMPAVRLLQGPQTVASVLERYEQPVATRLVPYFEAAGVSYPPEKITLLAMKQERKLELWAQGQDTGARFAFIRDYDIQKASGVAGPKLREGDRQVPEGLYEVEGLNPNSSYHLSMKLNYPNSFDLKHAKAEGRTQPGSNIFIHGKAVSVGCLAMGDPAIEELFVVAAQVDWGNVKVVIAPRDPRTKVIKADPDSMPAWTPDLYKAIIAEFRKYPRPV